MKKIFKTISLLILMSSLVSCKGIEFANQKISKAEEFTRGESMIFVAEEKNKYESRFGSEMWNLKSGDGDLYFKDYVVSNVKKFIEKIMKLKIVARDINVMISASDNQKLKDAVLEYKTSLTEEDKEYINCTDQDIENAFRDYHTARLVVDALSSGVNTELSISEAKVIKVQYIVFDDKESALDIQEKLKAKGANFAYFAKTRSKDNEIEMIIKRGDEMSTKFPELFYLSTGQVSDILQNINKYYLFKCVNDYMVDETEDRRIEILKVMKNNEFNQNFEKYDKAYNIKSNSNYWRDVDLADGNNCKIYKFDSIYYSYFPKSIK